jgi:hypothetical protein
MTNENITLIAALIAATASLMGLFLNMISAFYAEKRSAYRLSFQSSFLELGQLLYAIVALSVKMRKSNSDEAFDKERNKANQAAKEADALRRKLIYALWGVEDGIKQLVWVPTSIALLKNRRSGKEAKLVTDKATQLRMALDKIVRRAYLTGKPPSYFDQAIIKRKAMRLRRFCQSLGMETPEAGPSGSMNVG